VAKLTDCGYFLGCVSFDHHVPYHAHAHRPMACRLCARSHPTASLTYAHAHAAAAGGCKAPCFSPRRLRPRRCRPTSATVRRTFFRRRGGLTKLNPVSTYACHSSTRSPRASLMPTCAARQVRLPLERRQPAARAILPYHSLSCAPHGTHAHTQPPHRIVSPSCARHASFVSCLRAPWQSAPVPPRIPMPTAVLRRI
jgi:hypothetical protein